MKYERYTRAFLVSVRASISSNPERGNQMAGECTDVPFGLTAENINQSVFVWGQERRKIDSRFPKSTRSVTLPWAASTHVSVDNLFNLYVAFTDNHHLEIDHDLYDIEKITQLFQLFSETTKVLDVPAQLNLADTVTEGNIWASMHLLALTLRGMARDNDRRMGFSPALEKSISILHRLPFIDDGTDASQLNNLNTVGGDWYHFWTMMAFSYALEQRKDLVQQFGLYNMSYAIKFAVLERILLEHSARITMGVRRILAPPQTDVGGHYFADQFGRMLGKNLYQKFSADA